MNREERYDSRNINLIPEMKDSIRNHLFTKYRLLSRKFHPKPAGLQNDSNESGGKLELLCIHFSQDMCVYVTVNLYNQAICKIP